MTWPDEDSGGVVQLQLAYRGPADSEFGPPYANAEFEAWPRYGMSDDGTVIAAALGVGERADEVLLTRRDPDDGSWSDPQPVLEDRLEPWVESLSVHRSGDAIVEVWSETEAGQDRVHLVSCQAHQPCAGPASFDEPRQWKDLARSAGRDGAATYLYTVGRNCEQCLPKEIWARTLAA